MASLSAHLCRPDEHGRLGFHPGCPICRASASAVTAGVLAVASVAPSAAFAADDGVVEGLCDLQKRVAAPVLTLVGTCVAVYVVANDAGGVPDAGTAKTAAAMTTQASVPAGMA